MVNKGNHPEMALIQVSEILSFTHIYIIIYIYWMNHNDLTVRGNSFIEHQIWKSGRTDDGTTVVPCLSSSELIGLLHSYNWSWLDADPTSQSLKHGICSWNVLWKIWIAPATIIWWFGTFFIFPYIGNSNPNWLSYFSRWLKPPTSISCVSQSL